MLKGEIPTDATSSQFPRGAQTEAACMLQSVKHQSFWLIYCWALSNTDLCGVCVCVRACVRVRACVCLCFSSREEEGRDWLLPIMKNKLYFDHGPMKKRTADWNMVPIHSYKNCSLAQGNTKDRVASTSWEPSHALVHDDPAVEIFSFSSIVREGWVSTVALFTDHVSISY